MIRRRRVYQLPPVRALQKTIVLTQEGRLVSQTLCWSDRRPAQTKVWGKSDIAEAQEYFEIRCRLLPRSAELIADSLTDGEQVTFAEV